MKIGLHIPPAVDDLAFAAGYLVRCKPENDCASLFGPETTTAMYTGLTFAFLDAQRHAKTCANDHAVVAVARGPVAVAGEGVNPPGEDRGVSREPGNPVIATPRQMLSRGEKTLHDEIEPICRKFGCTPAGA